MLKNKDNYNISDQLRLLNVRFVSNFGDESPLTITGFASKEGGAKNYGENNASYASRRRGEIAREKADRDALENKWKEEEEAEHRKVKKEQDDEIVRVKADYAKKIEDMRKELQETYDKYVVEQAEERQKQRYFEMHRIQEEDKQIAKDDAAWEKRMADKAEEKKQREADAKKAEEDAAKKKEEDDINEMMRKAEEERMNMERGAVDSLQSFKPCNTSFNVEANKDAEVAVKEDVEEEAKVEAANQPAYATGGSKMRKNKVQNQLDLINKRYVDLMGNEDRIVTFNNAGKKKNKMQGGFWWFLIQLAIELAMIAVEAAIDAENDRREDEREREQDELDDLEEEFEDARIEYQQNIYEDIEDEQDFQNKRAQFAESIKNKPADEQRDLLRELDERRNDTMEDKAQRKEDRIELMLDEKEDFEGLKVELREDFENTLADMMEKQQDRMDEITAIMEAEEAQRKEVRDQRRQIAKDKREAHRKIIAGEKEEKRLEKEERKKERDERTAFEDRIKNRYEELNSKKLKDEAAIKGLSGYKGCQSNEKEKESLRQTARREIEEEEKKKIEDAAKGLITADALNGVGGSRRRRRKQKMEGGVQTVWWQTQHNEPVLNLTIDTYRNLLKKDLTKLTNPVLIQMAEEDGLATFHDGTYTYKTKQQLISNIVNFKTRTRYSTFADLAPFPNNGFGPAEEEFGNPVIHYMSEGILEIPEEYKERVKKIVDATLAGDDPPEDDE